MGRPPPALVSSGWDGGLGPRGRGSGRTVPLALREDLVEDGAEGRQPGETHPPAGADGRNEGGGGRPAPSPWGEGGSIEGLTWGEGGWDWGRLRVIPREPFLGQTIA